MHLYLVSYVITLAPHTMKVGCLQSKPGRESDRLLYTTAANEPDVRVTSVCGSRRQPPLPSTPPIITPGSDVPTAGTGETRPAEGRVCGSAYSARAVPHSA